MNRKKKKGFDFFDESTPVRQATKDEKKRLSFEFSATTGEIIDPEDSGFTEEEIQVLNDFVVIQKKLREILSRRKIK